MSKEIDIKTLIKYYNLTEVQQYDELIKNFSSCKSNKDYQTMLFKNIFEKGKEETESMCNIIKLLIQSKINVEDPIDESTGNTPLMVACLKGWKKVVEIILKEKPDVINQTNNQKCNCLFSALTAQKEIDIDLVYFLLKSGVNVNYKERFYGDSCLSLVVRQQNLTLISMLLNFNANPNVQVREQKETLLNIACGLLNKEIVLLLLSSKADPYLKSGSGQNSIEYISTIVENYSPDSDERKKAIEIKDTLIGFIKLQEKERVDLQAYSYSPNDINYQNQSPQINYQGNFNNLPKNSLNNQNNVINNNFNQGDKFIKFQKNQGYQPQLQNQIFNPINSSPLNSSNMNPTLNNNLNTNLNLQSNIQINNRKNAPLTNYYSHQQQHLKTSSTGVIRKDKEKYAQVPTTHISSNSGSGGVFDSYSKSFENLNAVSNSSSTLNQTAKPNKKPKSKENLRDKDENKSKSTNWIKKMRTELTNHNPNLSVLGFSNEDYDSLTLTTQPSIFMSKDDNSQSIIYNLNINYDLHQEIEILKQELANANNNHAFQHKTIFELHKNSTKLNEVLEYYRSELAISNDKKLRIEEILETESLLLKEAKLKLAVAEKKIEELIKLNSNINEKNLYLEKKCVELHYELENKKTEEGGVTLSNQNITNSPKRKEKSKNYLALKFSNNKMDTKMVLKNLHNDLIDFHEYNRKQIISNKPIVEKILENISSLIKTNFPNVDLMVFGSYSTNLCLAWSDIDLVLVNKSGTNDPNILRKVCARIQTQVWKKSVILVENTTIPLIKIVTTEQYLNYHIDISIQDNKHFGLKCVELVKMYLEQYEALEPLIISLKNILKCAGLNDPYKGGLSSYGLILLVVSFLQNEKEGGNIISKDKYNLGKLFIEFLYYYGVIFDPTKYIIITYLPNETIKESPQV